MTMVATVKFDDLVSSSKASSHSYGTHTCLCSRVAHTHFVHTGKQFLDQLRHSRFIRIWNPKTGSPFRSRLDRLNNSRMGMPKDGWPPGTDVINVIVAIHIPNVGAFCTIHKEWFPPNGSESPDGRIDSSRNMFQRSCKKFLRSICQSHKFFRIGLS